MLATLSLSPDDLAALWAVLAWAFALAAAGLVEYRDGSCCCGGAGLPCFACSPPANDTVCVDAGDPANWALLNFGCDPILTVAAPCSTLIGGLYECPFVEESNDCCVWITPEEVVCLEAHHTACPLPFYVEVQLCPVLPAGTQFNWIVFFTFLNINAACQAIGFNRAIYRSAPLDWDQCRTFPVNLPFDSIFITTGSGSAACSWLAGVASGACPPSVNLVACA